MDEFRTKPKSYAVLEKGMAFPFDVRKFDDRDVREIIKRPDVKTIPFLRSYSRVPTLAKEVKAALVNLEYQQAQGQVGFGNSGLERKPGGGEGGFCQAMEDKVEGKTPPAPAAKKARKSRKKAAKKAAKKGSGKK